jgi:hypothetical protein
VAGRPHHLRRLHHLGRPAMCWRISRNCFVYMSRRGSAKGIQCPKPVQGGNLAARPSCMIGRPIKWTPHAQSSSTAPPYSYKYHGAPSDRKCSGAGKGTARSHRRADGGAMRAHDIDGGARTARRRDEGDGTTAYRWSRR